MGWFIFATCFIGIGVLVLLFFAVYIAGRKAGAKTAQQAFAMMIEDLQADVKTAQQAAHAAQTEARKLESERDHWKGVANTDGSAWARMKKAYSNAQRKWASDLFNMERRVVRAETERERLLAEVADLWARIENGTNKELAYGGKARDTVADCPTLQSGVGAL